MFTDMFLQEGTPEDRADRGTVPGADLKQSVCVYGVLLVCLCEEVVTSDI